MRRFILILILGLGLVGGAQALEVRLYSQINAIPPEFHEELDLVLISETPSRIEFELPSDLKSEILEGDCWITDLILSCNLSSGANFISLELRGNLQDLGGDRWILKRIYPLSYDSLRLRLSIPSRYDLNPNLSFPPDFLEFSYGGMDAFLWRDYNRSGFHLMALIQSENPEIPWILMLVPGIIAGIAGCSGFLIYRSRKRKSKIKLPGLLESEQKVIQSLMRAKDHQLMQYQLQKLTGFSKPKLSRVIRSLEQRGLIEKHPHGSTNLIKLKPIQQEESSEV